MVRHAAGVDGRQRLHPARLPTVRQRRPRAVGHLHGQQEAHLPRRFVEQVVAAVARLRQRGAAVGEGRGGGVDLVEVEQRPQCDAAVDDIFAVVARVVPAAGHVERIVAARPDRAGEVGPLEASRDLVRMPGLARPGGTAGEAGLDRRPGALLVEDVEAAVREGAIEVGGDREGMARLAGDLQPIGAGGAQCGDVDLVDAVAGGGIGAEDPGLAARDHLPLRIQHAPRQRGRRIARHDRALRRVGDEADLVEVQPRERSRADRQQRGGSDRAAHHSTPRSGAQPLSGEGAVMRRNSPCDGRRAAVSA